MKRTILLAAVAVVFAGAVATTVANRRPERRVQTVHVIKLRLSMNGKEVARISTPAGKMATMSREGVEQIGLTPSVQGDGVALVVAVRSGTATQFKVLRRYSLVRNKPAAVGTERTSLTVEWLETTTFTPSTSTSSSGSGPCTTCCVTCDGFTFCACEVSTSCGHCCCKETCGCVEG